jgi:hypothetical protein
MSSQNTENTENTEGQHALSTEEMEIQNIFTEINRLQDESNDKTLEIEANRATIQSLEERIALLRGNVVRSKMCAEGLQLLKDTFGDYEILANKPPYGMDGIIKIVDSVDMTRTSAMIKELCRPLLITFQPSAVDNHFTYFFRIGDVLKPDVYVTATDLKHAITIFLDRLYHFLKTVGAEAERQLKILEQHHPFYMPVTTTSTNKS